jgi:hypothetical protein
MSRTTKGAAPGPTVAPTASAARYSTRQLTSRQAHCAHLGRDGGPHACGRAAHRRRRRPQCPRKRRVGPCGDCIGRTLLSPAANFSLQGQGHCADLGRASGPHARGRAAHRRRRRPQCPRPRRVNGRVLDATPVGCGSQLCGRRTAQLCGRRTALTVASQGGHLRVVEVLIAAGADVAAKTDFG